jgi:hypothetical protein
MRKLWCQHCKYKTTHNCLPDIQSDYGRVSYPEVPSTDGPGLLWKCERCGRSEARTAHQVLTAEGL